MQNVAATKTVFGSMYRLFFQLFMFTKEFVILTIFFWSSSGLLNTAFFNFLHFFGCQTKTSLFFKNCCGVHVFWDWVLGLLTFFSKVLIFFLACWELLGCLLLGGFTLKARLWGGSVFPLPTLTW